MQCRRFATPVYCQLNQIELLKEKFFFASPLFPPEQSQSGRLGTKLLALLLCKLIFSLLNLKTQAGIIFAKQAKLCCKANPSPQKFPGSPKLFSTPLPLLLLFSNKVQQTLAAKNPLSGFPIFFQQISRSEARYHHFPL